MLNQTPKPNSNPKPDSKLNSNPNNRLLAKNKERTL
jgi:hypothetical protein